LSSFWRTREAAFGAQYYHGNKRRFATAGIAYKITTSKRLDDCSGPGPVSFASNPLEIINHSEMTKGSLADSAQYPVRKVCSLSG
jgi:hypothetical protein